MCTLTILKQDDNILAVMNRDDDKNRQEGEVKDLGSVKCPIDLRSGGTWIGINNDGVSGFLLNRYDEHHIEHKISRGEIVPKVLDNGNVDDCIAFFKKMNLEKYTPFCLVLLSHETLVKFDWNGANLTQENIDLQQYYVLTSSSLKEQEVKQWRYGQFDEWWRSDKRFVNGIPTFNLKQMKGFEEYSVMVLRDKVCTLSLTKITLSKNKAQMHYLSGNEIQNLIIN